MNQDFSTNKIYYITICFKCQNVSPFILNLNQLSLSRSGCFNLQVTKTQFILALAEKIFFLLILLRRVKGPKYADRNQSLCLAMHYSGLASFAGKLFRYGDKNSYQKL